MFVGLSVGRETLQIIICLSVCLFFWPSFVWKEMKVGKMHRLES